MRANSTRHGLPVVATALLVLLVLGAIGLANGSWTEQLTINGSVHTAQIEVKWQTPIGLKCADNDTGDPAVKDLAQTTRTLDGGKFFFNVENGYPGYAAKCNVRMQNNGTLPVVIGVPVFKPGEGLTQCVVSKSGTPPDLVVTLNCNELSVEYVDGTGTVLNQGAKPGFSFITITVKKGAEQGAKYDFEIQACVAINTKGLCGEGNNGPVGGD